MLRLFAALFACVAIVALVAVGGIALVFGHYGRQLPDHSELARHEPAIASRVYAGSGRLLAEYARRSAVFVPIEAIPKPRDRRLSRRRGQELLSPSRHRHAGVVRAVITNLPQIGSDRRPVGASTITQQVAKNMLIGNELSIERKSRRRSWRVRIEQALQQGPDPRALPQRDLPRRTAPMASPPPR